MKKYIKLEVRDIITADLDWSIYSKENYIGIDENGNYWLFGKHTSPLSINKSILENLTSEEKKEETPQEKNNHVSEDFVLKFSDKITNILKASK